MSDHATADDRAEAAPGATPGSVRTLHEPLEGIHDLPVREQIARYRLLHDELAKRLTREGD